MKPESLVINLVAVRPLTHAFDEAMASIEAAVAAWLAARLAMPRPATCREIAWAEPGYQTSLAKQVGGSYRAPKVARDNCPEAAEAATWLAMANHMASTLTSRVTALLRATPGPHREVDDECGGYELSRPMWAPPLIAEGLGEVIRKYAAGGGVMTPSQLAGWAVRAVIEHCLARTSPTAWGHLATPDGQGAYAAFIAELVTEGRVAEYVGTPQPAE